MTISALILAAVCVHFAEATTFLKNTVLKSIWVNNKRTERSEERHGKYHSPLLGSVRNTVKGLHCAGVMDKETMRQFDILCLMPVRLQMAK